jgi:hypothetical protein
MRNTYLILAIFFSYVAHAQTINRETSTTFITKQVRNVNIKLWNAAVSNKVTAYANDSLKTVLKSDSILAWFKTYKRREITDPNEGVFNKYGSVVFEPHPFNVKEDATGLMLNFKPTFDAAKASINKQVISVAPTYLAITESGIELGDIPMFHIKMEDLSKALTSQEIELLKCIIIQRTTLGDFKDWYLYDDIESESLGTSMAYKSQRKENYWMQFTHTHDTILGVYILKVLSLATEDNYTQKGNFYSDLALKDKYSDLAEAFSSTYTFSVPDNETADDDAYKDFSVTETFDFSTIASFEVTKKGTDYVLHFTPTINDKTKEVFFLYSEIRPLLQSFDVVVMDALLKVVAK